MYSQNNEEEIILRELGALEHGRFLDIGAYDGKTFSNTRALAEKGWSGVCLEPSPRAFVGLLDLYKGREDVELVSAALTLKDGPIRFHEAGGDAISTSVAAHRDRWRSSHNVPYQPMTALGISWETLGATFGWNFQFINIDVEAENQNLLLACPIARFTKLRLLCVEKDSPEARRPMMEWLLAQGLTLVAENGENLLVARR